MTQEINYFENETHPLSQNGRKSMKRTLTLTLIALAAAALFGGLVYAVLVAAHVSEPAAATVYGLTPRRLWATTAAGLALVGVVIGGLALSRSAGRIDTRNGRIGAIMALVAGLIALVNGGLNLAIANGGPGTGNGVVGGAAALVLGLIGMTLGGMALARSRRSI
jgi:FtsH-binding integral membrane protein